MRRQPRLNPDELSYNFEQYGRYTTTLARAKKVDDERSRKFYKLVKYVKKNIDTPNDALVHDFTVNKQYDPDLIDIPEEFQDLPIADVKPKDYKKKKSNKKLIRTRTSKTMANYDAWRVHDRDTITGGIKAPNVAKLLISPKLLRHTFGIPDIPKDGIWCTGEYQFEDNNLDVYKLYDYKQTDLFHGLNREDEYYTTAKNMRKPHHKRKRKWPSVTEFWNLEEPVIFKLSTDSYADVPRFKRWFRAQLKAGVEDERSFEDKILEKYKDKIDLCEGKWEEEGVINTDIAAHKFNVNDYLTKQELRDYPFEITHFEPPKMFDLSKAKRVKTTK